MGRQGYGILAVVRTRTQSQIFKCYRHTRSRLHTQLGKFVYIYILIYVYTYRNRLWLISCKCYAWSLSLFWLTFTSFPWQTGKSHHDDISPRISTCSRWRGVCKHSQKTNHNVLQRFAKLFRKHHDIACLFFCVTICRYKSPGFLIFVASDTSALPTSVFLLRTQQAHEK